jgi:hypothetical protein
MRQSANSSGTIRIEAALPIDRGEDPMRRASIILALVGLAVLGPSAVALAAPKVTLKAKAVPIKGFPRTGNIYGAGAAVEAHIAISGTEGIGGVPSPLTHVNFYLPFGSRINARGFVTCSPATLENVGPKGCPKKSQASPLGSAHVAQKIGAETVREPATIQAFFAPGGGLQFYTNAEAPISAQLIASTGHYINARKPYGPELDSEVRLITTLPEAPPVSTESINLVVGAAYKKGKRTVYYGTMPKKGQCPKGGFPLKAELTFQTGETATATTKAPCPRK